MKHKVLGMALLGTTLLFLWHMELVTEFIPHWTLTNGYFRVDGVQLYHLLMYLMLVVNIAATYTLIGDKN